MLTFTFLVLFHLAVLFIALDVFKLIKGYMGENQSDILHAGLFFLTFLACRIALGQVLSFIILTFK